MRVGSLFSGIGGIDLGLERAGMRVVWQVECDPFCVNVLERHWPAVHRRRDVRLATAANLGPCELVAGGFPCQDISAAGKGAGLERGHRSGLWREFARLVGELRPSWVLVENVPALRRRGGDIVLGDLEAAGYTAWPLVVGARHVGAPHRRDRVWIVGRLADAALHPDAGATGEHRAPGREAEGDLCRGQEPTLGQERQSPCPSGAGVADASQQRERATNPQDTAERRAGAWSDLSGVTLRHESGGSSGAGGADTTEPRTVGVGLADTNGTGCAGEWGRGLLDGQRAAFGHDADGCHRAVGQADRDPTRLEGWRVPGCERAHQWPARPGSPPHDWEQPRTVEFPLGRAAHGVSARLAGARWKAELRALGNAVVPQVVEAIGRAILSVEARA